MKLSKTQLEVNLKGLCDHYGHDFQQFLSDMDVEDVYELSIYSLQAICEEYTLDIQSLLFKPLFQPRLWKEKLAEIKLLILDVDGVMTDGGMYQTESGDQFKKFNTKDGMAILHLTKNDFQVAIISSGFKGEAVSARAKLLGIQHCTVSRDPKTEVLDKLCTELSISLNQVAMIGDDINDLPVLRKIGFSASPADAVDVVKSEVDVVLSKKGGEGCVREFIDNYLLQKPIG
jgi:3-deoxy-D-manno-octulosonate 8-phosphate phosphatase (KDO 8-P phosphatase)